MYRILILMCVLISAVSCRDQSSGLNHSQTIGGSRGDSDVVAEDGKDNNSDQASTNLPESSLDTRATETAPKGESSTEQLANKTDAGTDLREQDAPAAKGYLIANSHKEYLSEESVSKYSKEYLRFARNEILARHGRVFEDKNLQNYFKNTTWYQPDKNAKIQLNDYEKANLSLMKNAEKNRAALLFEVQSKLLFEEKPIFITYQKSDSEEGEARERWQVSVLPEKYRWMEKLSAVPPDLIEKLAVDKILREDDHEVCPVASVRMEKADVGSHHFFRYVESNDCGGTDDYYKIVNSHFEKSISGNNATTIRAINDRVILITETIGCPHGAVMKRLYNTETKETYSVFGIYNDHVKKIGTQKVQKGPIQIYYDEFSAAKRATGGVIESAEEGAEIELLRSFYLDATKHSYEVKVGKTRGWIDGKDFDENFRQYVTCVDLIDAKRTVRSILSSPIKTG